MSVSGRHWEAQKLGFFGFSRKPHGRTMRKWGEVRERCEQEAELQVL